MLFYIITDTLSRAFVSVLIFLFCVSCDILELKGGDTMTNTSERILNLRRVKKMGQEEFAELCGLSRSSIARYESGKPINRIAAQKISAACDIPISYILDDQKEPGHFSGGFSDDEIEIISMYRAVSQDGRDATKSFLRALSGKHGKSTVALD